MNRGMKILIRILIGIVLLNSGIVLAQVQKEPTPLPPDPVQGSPFPLGQEPKLTHTVKVYWTTLGGIVTDIKVKAEGRRPTQIYCDRSLTEGSMQIFSTINPRCDYNFRLSTAGSSGEDREGFTTWRASGDGTVTVRVHGFEEEDYSRPPEVIVKYLRNGKVIGENSTVGKR